MTVTGCCSVRSADLGRRCEWFADDRIRRRARHPHRITSASTACACTGQVDPLQGPIDPQFDRGIDRQMHLGRSIALDQDQEFAQVHGGSSRRPSKNGALHCLYAGTRAGIHTAVPEESVNAPVSFLKDLEAAQG